MALLLPTRGILSHKFNSSLSLHAQIGSTANFITLRDIKVRLKAVGSIKKITKSMKMVASSKLKRSQERLAPSRNVSQLANEFTSNFLPKDAKKNLFVVVSSDKGLCGALNSGLARHVKKSVINQKNQDHQVICLGDKGFNQLKKPLKNEIVFYAGDTGKKALNFTEASVLAENVLHCDYDQLTLLYNKFNSVISNTIVVKEIVSYPKLIKKEYQQKEGSMKIEDYQYLEDEKSHLRDLTEFNLSLLLFSAFAENQTSELGARMTSMDNASRSAGDMIKKLEIQYNRGRQASITKELSEIISGAESVKKKVD